MNCKQVRKHLDDYRTGTLDKVLVEIIDKHLQSCPDCRKIKESEETVSDFLKQADVELSDTSVADILLNKLDEIDRKIRMEPEPNRSIDPRFKWILITALIIGVILIGFMVIPFEPRSEYHDVGHRSGPRFTWIGTVPFDDDMETRWTDPFLIEPDRSEVTPLEEKGTDIEALNRITHSLDFNENETSSQNKMEENQ